MARNCESFGESRRRDTELERGPRRRGLVQAKEKKEVAGLNERNIRIYVKRLPHTKTHTTKTHTVPT